MNKKSDRVAEKIMSMTDDNPIASKLPHKVEKIDRKCATCEMIEKEEKEEKLKISRKLSNTSVPEESDEISNEINNIRSDSGIPLDRSSREFMETRFGYDFSHVRIHTDDNAAKSAQSVNALAYTIGNNIVFEGQYSPESDSGRKLLAHELAHVVQQNSEFQPHSQPTVMRQVDAIPSRLGVRVELIKLYARLTKLQFLEVIEGMSIGEISEVENMIKEREELLGETNSIRERIIFYRIRIRELMKQMKQIDAAPPPSPPPFFLQPSAPTSSPLVKEKIIQDIRKYKFELKQALEENSKQLEEKIKEIHTKRWTSAESGIAVDEPSLNQELKKAEAELAQNETERKNLLIPISPEQFTSIQQLFKTGGEKVEGWKGHHCMQAFDVAIGTMEIKGILSEAQTASEQFDKAHHMIKKGTKLTIDALVANMRTHGRAGRTERFTSFKDSSKDPPVSWKPAVRETLLSLVGSECPGVYAFAVSLHQGWHSATLLVDTRATTPQIWWVDQGFKPSANEARVAIRDVSETGKLEDEMRNFKPSFESGSSVKRRWNFTDITAIIPAPSPLIPP